MNDSVTNRTTEIAARHALVRLLELAKDVLTFSTPMRRPKCARKPAGTPETSCDEYPEFNLLVTLRKRIVVILAIAAANFVVTGTILLWPRYPQPVICIVGAAIALFIFKGSILFRTISTTRRTVDIELISFCRAGFSLQEYRHHLCTFEIDRPENSVELDREILLADLEPNLNKFLVKWQPHSDYSHVPTALFLCDYTLNKWIPARLVKLRDAPDNHIVSLWSRRKIDESLDAPIDIIALPRIQSGDYVIYMWNAPHAGNLQNVEMQLELELDSVKRILSYPSPPQSCWQAVCVIEIRDGQLDGVISTS